ncbi:MAG TPA: TIR domain-containing protein, partial [Bryobacteraceae bacterium]
MPMVFISHSSKDKAAAEQLSAALASRGIETWLDKWEIDTADDIVARLNQGLDTSTAGIVLFSEHTANSRWTQKEISYLIWAHVEESKPLIPVAIDERAQIPPLLRPYLLRNITEVDAIADAVLNRKAARPQLTNPNWGEVKHVLIALHRDAPNGPIKTTVTIGGKQYAFETCAKIPTSVSENLATFRRGFRHSALRSPVDAERKTAENQLKSLGDALANLCLPGDSALAIEALVDGAAQQVGTTVEVCIEASDAELLALPFEALRLRNDNLLATRPTVVMLRRPAGLASHSETRVPLPGPLKVLVAVAAPDEGNSDGAVLDQERELQNILNAVDKAHDQGSIDVRILEVGHPGVIAEALKADAYHVLHISCHGLPGALEMEDEDGHAVRIDAQHLLEPLQNAGRPLPLVFLSSCHGGVHELNATASFAEALLRGGIPSVL